MHLLPQFYYVYQIKLQMITPLYGHSPLWLQINSVSNKGPKPFRFFSYWMKCPGFNEVLHKSWQSTPSGTPQFQFVRKLKALEQALKAWCKSDNISTSKRIQVLRDKLNQNNAQQLINPFSEDLYKEEQQVKIELNN